MKTTLSFDLTPSISKLVFEKGLIKRRAELINLCMETCRELQNSIPDDEEKIEVDKIVVKRAKMSRIFFFSHKKYISITTPLSLVLQPDNKPIFKYNDSFLTSELWSWIIASYHSYKEDFTDLEDLGYYSELAKENGIADFEEIFDCFLNADYGYIRYDIDKDGYKLAKDNGNGHMHPEHHCDIHLDSSATFKSGLIDKITPKDFIQILNNEDERWYMCRHKDVPKALRLK